MSSRWTIDLDRGEVRSGAGEHLALRRRTFALLLYLAERHDSLVTKDELIEANWRGLVVTDNSLTKCISEIRHALGEGVRDTVRTLSGRGYMLTGWQVEGRRLRSPDAAGDSGATPGNLPAPRALIGRGDEIERIVALLRTHRLVTITGPGGVGKTSVGLACAHAAAGAHTDGAFLVELAPLLSGEAAVAAAQRVLGMAASQPAPDAFAEALRPLRLLLVLDNCEHLIADVAAMAAAVLAQAPGVTILATSREALAVEGEQLFQLPSLASPPDVDLPPAEALAYPAVALLEARARLADSDFALCDADAAAAANICRKLDGMPLAIALAAGRLSTMSLAELERGLERRLDLLTAPNWTDGRQRTLRATIGWSVDLLNARQQALFEQIGVFSGPVLAEDIIAVCRVDGTAPDLAMIVSLADKSLLNVQRQGAVTRYDYFETTRHYALERLAMGADRHAARRRHAGHVASVLQRGEEEIATTPTATWRASYAPYLDNVRAALAWSFSPAGDPLLGLKLAARAGELFEELALQGERIAWLEKALSLAVAVDHPGLLGRVKLWRALGTSWGTGDSRLLHEAAGLFARSGETLWEGRARAMTMVGDAYAGNWARVWDNDAQALALLEPHGATRILGDYYRYRSMVMIASGRTGEAGEAIRRSAAIAERVGDAQGMLWALSGLTNLAFESGDLRAAIAQEEECLERADAMPSPFDAMYSCVYLATCRLLLGEAHDARKKILRAFSLARRLGTREIEVTLVALAALWLAVREEMSTALALAMVAKTAGAQRFGQLLQIERHAMTRLEALLACATEDALSAAGSRVAHWRLEDGVKLAVETLARS